MFESFVFDEGSKLFAEIHDINGVSGNHPK